VRTAVFIGTSTGPPHYRNNIKHHSLSYLLIQHIQSIMTTTVKTKPAFTIPTVDISPYLENPDSPQSKEVVNEIRQACKTSGFFQIVDHGIPQSLQKTVFDSSRTFFDLPIEEKLKLKCADGRGYEIIGSQTLQAGTNPDLKEVCPPIVHCYKEDLY
jgi:hypothetical protein